MPCTPTPGGVDDEQRYDAPHIGVLYGSRLGIGRAMNCLEIGGAAGDVAADEIRVAALEVGGE